MSGTARREVLMRAAVEVFGTMGFDRATTRLISHRAGVSTPILYRQFESKLGMYESVVRAAGATLITTWTSVPVDGDPESYFRRSTLVFFLWIEQHRHEWWMLFCDNPQEPAAADVLARMRQTADAAMREALTGAGGEAGLSADLTLLLGAAAAQVTGAGNALASWWWNHQQLSAATVAEFNHAVVWRGLSSLLEGDRPTT